MPRGFPLQEREAAEAARDALEDSTVPTMDFTIHVRSEKTGKEWSERYQKETTDPERWGRDIIAWFNSTTRPGEAKREFLRVEVHGEVASREHKWTKTSLTSVVHGGQIFDRMECERCKITGKRFRLTEIRRDSQFRAKVYARCDTTQKHQAKS